MSSPVPPDVVKRVLQSYKQFAQQTHLIGKNHRSKVAELLRQAENRRVDAIKEKINNVS